ncbi:restriction endonuclease subunit S [Aeromonas sp. QDB02]|uniref:restriction endonuclease subunit S n=1 Tax=Aeromonas sp. QDB02 TaxID=2990476 RepID=UPI0022DF8A95|nr:restriction endonuclease subunit S [Aeromonas sp. QDB02]
MAGQMMQETAGKVIPTGYKQTEVGVIPEDWDVCLLKNICSSFKTGKLDANAMILDGEYRFYTCARNYYWINQYAFDDEALLISGNGANVGYIHYYKGKFNAYQRTYVLTCFSADIQFLKKQMEVNLSERIRTEVNAGNTPYITMDTLTDMMVPLPKNRQEQTAIANVLSDSDALIGALEQLITKKQAIKSATMQQLLTGRTRLPAFALRPDGTPKGYKSSELGEIPEDWACYTFNDVVDSCSSGATPYRGNKDFYKGTGNSDNKCDTHG